MLLNNLPFFFVVNSIELDALVAYVGDTFSNSVKKVPVEVLHKPVSRKTVVDTIEHRQVYQQL
jgi:hypothetical protein